MNTIDIESVTIQYYRRSQGYRSKSEALNKGAVYGGDIHHGYTTVMDVLASACSLAKCLDSTNKDDVVACLLIKGKIGLRIVEVMLDSAADAVEQYLVDCELPDIHPDNQLVIMLRQADMDRLTDKETCTTTKDLCWFPVKHVEIYTDRIRFLEAGCRGDERFGHITQDEDDWVLGDRTYEFCFVYPRAQWEGRPQFRVAVPESSKLFI